VLIFLLRCKDSAVVIFTMQRARKLRNSAPVADRSSRFLSS
jgi:hypothetical protein